MTIITDIRGRMGRAGRACLLPVSQDELRALVSQHPRNLDADQPIDYAPKPAREPALRELGDRMDQIKDDIGGLMSVIASTLSEIESLLAEQRSLKTTMSIRLDAEESKASAYIDEIKEYREKLSPATIKPIDEQRGPLS